MKKLTYAERSKKMCAEYDAHLAKFPLLSHSKCAVLDATLKLKWRV
jgi:hypothetical protein